MLAWACCKKNRKYLLGTKDKGIIFKPDHIKGLECYIDATFAAEWQQVDADNPENFLSKTGYVIYYADCRLLWTSNLQTEILFSTAESEYIALSQVMRNVIPLIHLLIEINCVYPIPNPEPVIKWKLYEDNESCIDMSKTKRFSPRTRYISTKYHRFRYFVDKEII